MYNYVLFILITVKSLTGEPSFRGLFGICSAPPFGTILPDWKVNNKVAVSQFLGWMCCSNLLYPYDPG